MNGPDFERVPGTPVSPISISPQPFCHIELPCYEGPDGRGPGIVSITEEALKRHIFVAGATGAGKTTLLRAIMRELIASQAHDEDRKVGLVVLDFKGDDTPAFVKAAAAAVGRESDVRVLSLESPVAYDFFGDCRSLGDVTEFAQRLVFGCGRVETHDNFWDEYRNGLLAAALTWLTLNHADDRTFSTWISHASSWLLADSMPAALDEDLQLFRTRCESMANGSPERIGTQHALQLIGDWERGMDFRTRANVKATLHLALRPLLEPPVLRLFRAVRSRKFRVASAVERGRILVVSIRSFLHPELASLVGRCVKADYYKSVFSRKPGGRLAMLVGDEFHLAVTSGNTRYDDCHALPLMRAQNAGLIAATQTLAGIDRVIGNLNRRVLVGNFGTVFYFRSTEAEIDGWAQQACGSREIDVSERVRVRDSRMAGGLAEGYERIVTRKERRAVCGPGMLARLEPGQAYLLQEGLMPSPFPIWVAGEP